MSETNQHESWPSLREDLTLHPGPSDPNGAPTWTLHDPIRNKYFSLDWVAFEVVTRLSLKNTRAIAAAINSSTTLTLQASDVKAVLEFLLENELVIRHNAKSTEWLQARVQARDVSLLQRLIHSYLFFRVPLFHPDALLGRLVNQLAFLWTPSFFKLTAIVLLAGIWGAARQWETFTATLVDTFSWQGLAGFAGALIAAKILHEFGHGLTAKRFGCRVPTMGVAFLVMWPMAYTDVTESWKLNSNRKRFFISAAGITTELVIASWALLAWSLLPDGAIRSATFFLATTSIVATLAINASPFMRFDGYFLLCDSLGMPNLHERSFAMARWWFREKLFRLGEAPPEVFSRNKQQFMVLFAFGTWLYRFFVFLGIALLVYNFFFKLLGIILFFIELWYFIFRPVWTELNEWRKRWGQIGPVIRQRPAFYLGLFFLAVLALPYDITVNSQGLLKPENSFRVVTYQASQIVAMPPVAGSVVSAGMPLMAMESPELEHRLRKAQVKLITLQRQISGAGFDSETFAQQAIFKEQLMAAQEELDGLLLERERLRPVAPFSGKMIDVNPDMFVGEWVPRNTHLMSVIGEESWVVDTYIEEAELTRIGLGHWVRFIPQGVGLAAMWGQVVAIDKDTTRVLADGPLASTAGGEILVREQNKRAVPERAIYRVRIRLVSDNPMQTRTMLRGSVVILGYPKSILGDLARGTLATIVREAGF
jgi:putative peptide zinc metalloprotease protein